MERVLGIGGYFIRAADPAALGAWYRDCLGLDTDENGLWQQDTGPTVFAPFEAGTDYFGSSTQQTMLNFRVADLAAMLTQLRDKGAAVVDDIQDMAGGAASVGSPTPRATGSNSGNQPSAERQAHSPHRGDHHGSGHCGPSPSLIQELLERRTSPDEVPHASASAGTGAFHQPLRPDMVRS